MALGIKKITESVIEDGRSLVLIGSSYHSGTDNIDFKDNKAIPTGAVIAVNKSKSEAYGTLRIKNGENKQIRIDASTTLAPKTVTRNEIGNAAVFNEHLNAKDAPDATRSVANHNIRDNAIDRNKIKNNEVISSKIPSGAILNKHLNAKDANNADRTVATYNIQNNAITEEKILKDAVTTVKIRDGNITTAKIKDNNVTREKLSPALRNELDKLRSDINTLNADLQAFKNTVEQRFKKMEAEFNTKLANLKKEMTDTLNNTINQYNLKNAVTHYKNDIVGDKDAAGKYTSTPLSDIKCSGNITCAGDINGKRVYFMTYQDLAEAYIPGEDLEAGDIVAMHEDGKVYKAESMNDCIVGVISNEYANCFGATKEELFNGSKIAVGMIGKVHVKVKGPVNIGQKITVSLSDAGIGMAWNHSDECIGKALESFDCDFDEVHDVLVQIRPM